MKNKFVPFACVALLLGLFGCNEDSGSASSISGIDNENVEKISSGSPADSMSNETESVIGSSSDAADNSGQSVNSRSDSKNNFYDSTNSSTSESASSAEESNVSTNSGTSESSSSAETSSTSVSKKGMCKGEEYDTATSFCAKREGVEDRVYRKVTITIEAKNYSKTWMAENLNYESIEGSGCCHNDESYCATYGRLYTWATAMGKSEDECGYDHDCDLGTGSVRGICPDGWHMPSYDEWEALFAAVDYTGLFLKSTSGWNCIVDPKSGACSKSGNGLDRYGFAALPGGQLSIDGSDAGKYAYFWSASQLNKNSAYHTKLPYDHDGIDMIVASKGNAFSVRCLKDSE